MLSIQPLRMYQERREMINLGDTVKDKISGFTGVVVARTEWLYGCIRLAVQSQKTTKNGSLLEKMLELLHEND